MWTHFCFLLLTLQVLKVDVYGTEQYLDALPNTIIFRPGNAGPVPCKYCTDEYYSDIRFYSEDCYKQYSQDDNKITINGKIYYRLCVSFKAEKDFIRDVDCEYPLIIHNGTTTLFTVYNATGGKFVKIFRAIVGTKLRVECDDGFIPESYAIPECIVQNGRQRWSPEPSCRRTGCFPRTFKNGLSHCNDGGLLENGTICNISCFTGYRPEYSTVTCMNGNWMGQFNCIQEEDYGISLMAGLVVFVFVVLLAAATAAAAFCFKKINSGSRCFSTTNKSSSEDLESVVSDSSSSENPHADLNGSTEFKPLLTPNPSLTTSKTGVASVKTPIQHDDRDTLDSLNSDANDQLRRATQVTCQGRLSTDPHETYVKVVDGNGHQQVEEDRRQIVLSDKIPVVGTPIVSLNSAPSVTDLGFQRDPSDPTYTRDLPVLPEHLSDQAYESQSLISSNPPNLMPAFLGGDGDENVGRKGEANGAVEGSDTGRGTLDLENDPSF